MGFIENNKKTLLAVLVIAIIAAALLTSIPNATGPPRIQVSPDSFDFGKMEPKAAEQVFSLKNVGGMPLEILKISTSCGCTTAWADSETVQPGEETVLHVKFDPNAMPKTVAGKVLRVVYLKSNDPETPELEIEITANVQEAST
jgi:hypothetical protein